MGTIRVSTVIAAPPVAVWDEVVRIERHVDWMAEAESIEFTSSTHRGVGTTFDCATRLGPLRLVDRMEITEWQETRAIGVRHVGVVTGAGRFRLDPLGAGRTRFSWEERLRYPWWLGGRVGGVAGDRVLARVWRANLRRLATIVESRA